MSLFSIDSKDGIQSDVQIFIKINRFNKQYLKKVGGHQLKSVYDDHLRNIER